MISDEYAVIGALCMEPGLIDQFAAYLRQEHFTSEDCAAVYQEAVDRRRAFDATCAANVLANVKGAEAANKWVIECMDIAPVKYAVEDHARAIYDEARRRALQSDVHDALITEGDRAALAERLAGIAQQYLAEDNVKADTMTTALIDVIRGVEHGQDKRLDTGFYRLDRLLKGLYPGQLIIIGARPGVGKSAFALNLALNVARVGKVVFFSMEMTATEIAQRAIVNRSSVPLDAFLDGEINKDNMPGVTAAAGELSKQKTIVIDDRPALTIEQLRACVRRHPDARLVIVDYLGLMQTSRRDGNRNLELGELARSLKNFAVEADVPIVALSQLNRGTSDTDRPGLRSFRDSGELEQHASKALLMWRKEDGMIAVDVAKNRQGRTGIVQYEFDGAHMRFTESPIAYFASTPKTRRGFMTEETG